MTVFKLNTTKKIISVYLLVTIFLVASICVQMYTDFQHLVKDNYAKLLESNSRLALEFIDSTYEGAWRVRDGQLYKGNVLINNNTAIVDEIKDMVNGEVTIFLGDTRVTTTVTKEGIRQIGTQASPKVVEEVIQKGNEYRGVADVLGVEFDTKYTPLRDVNGQVIGMFFIGFPIDELSNVIISSIRDIILWAFILVVLVTVVYDLVIRTNILRPLAAMKDYLTAIASGVFTAEIPTKYLKRRDEFGEMANTLREMQGSLKQMILKIRDKSDEVNKYAGDLEAASEEMSASSQEFASTMQHLATQASQQTQNLSAIAEAMEDVTRSIEHAYDSLKKVGNETDNTVAKANVGKNELDKLAVALEDIGNAFATVVGKVEALTNSVKEIGGITEMISAISAQTDLLALNAAIEAARAGEHGRGFAVVADEVRKLAEVSRESTDKIIHLISSTATDSDDVIATANEVKSLVDDQLTVLRNTVSSFEDILASVEKIAPYMEETYKSMNGIVAKKDVVISKVESTTAIVQENSASTEEIAASSEQLSASFQGVASTAQNLNAIAKSLMEVVTRFKF